MPPRREATALACRFGVRPALLDGSRRRLVGWMDQNGADVGRSAGRTHAFVAAAALVYAPSLGNGFIWDDDLYVQNNVALRSLGGLHDLWLRIGTTPQYYPLVYTTFWIEQHLWGLVPVGYHATNALLHALAAVLAWRLLERLAVPGAWLAAAVFAAHPVAVESVAWVTERKNVLSLVLALIALLAYVRASPPESAAARRPRGPAYALALVAYAAALLAKTVTASVPAVLLVVRWWKRGRIMLRDVAWLAPFFAIGVVLASVTVRMERTHVGAIGAEWDLSLAQRLLIAGRAPWFYAGKLLWPHDLAFFYPRWTLDPTVWWQVAFPLAALAVIVALFLARRRIGRGPLAAVLIFAGVLTPALGFFDVYPFRYSFVADHFQYHASLALIALGAAAIVRATRSLRPTGRAVLATALLVAFGSSARAIALRYRDLPTLYRSVLQINPTSWAAHNNLGKILQNEGRHGEALEQFQAAARLSPDDARILNNLGSTLSALDRLDEASAVLERALVAVGEPTDRADTRTYLAVVRIRQDRPNEAADLLRTALGFRPNDAWVQYNLGVALGAAGDLEQGAAWLRKSLATDPDAARTHHELGAMLRALGDAPGAANAFERAARLEPGNAVYQTDLGVARLVVGDVAGARDALSTALRLAPGQTQIAELLQRIEAPPDAR